MNERKVLDQSLKLFITFNTLSTEFALPKAATTLILKSVTVRERVLQLFRRKTTASLKLYGCHHKEAAYRITATYS